MSSATAPAPVPGSASSVPQQFSIGVPGDWLVLPLDVDRQARDRRIHHLVEKHAGRQDAFAHLRRRVIVRLRKSAAEAVNAGGFLMAMQSRFADGRPMSASAVFSILPLTKDASGNVLTDAELMAAFLADNEKANVMEHSVQDLPIGRAARIRRPTNTGVHGNDGREVVSETVQYYVPLPDLNSTVALVFSTPILPLVDAYIELFDTMAKTAKWVEETNEETTQ